MRTRYSQKAIPRQACGGRSVPTAPVRAALLRRSCRSSTGRGTCSTPRSPARTWGARWSSSLPIRRRPRAPRCRSTAESRPRSRAELSRVHFPGMEPTPRMRVAATDADLATVAELAGRIWRAHFPSILSARQIQYMLAWMYDAAQLREEVARGVVYELLLDEDRPFGYCAYEEQLGGELRLHKLYLEVAEQGRGFGSLALQHVEDEARRRGLARVVLGVNKSNEKALRAYRRNGYAVREAVKKDIGGGCLMDGFTTQKGTRRR